MNMMKPMPSMPRLPLPQASIASRTLATISKVLDDSKCRNECCHRQPPNHHHHRLATTSTSATDNNHNHNSIISTTSNHSNSNSNSHHNNISMSLHDDEPLGDDDGVHFYQQTKLVAAVSPGKSPTTTTSLAPSLIHSSMSTVGEDDQDDHNNGDPDCDVAAFYSKKNSYSHDPTLKRRRPHREPPLLQVQHEPFDLDFSESSMGMDLEEAFAPDLNSSIMSLNGSAGTTGHDSSYSFVGGLDNPPSAPADEMKKSHQRPSHHTVQPSRRQDNNECLEATATPPLVAQLSPTTSASLSVSSNNNDTVLHETCVLFPQNAHIVETALLGCPRAVFTPVALPNQDYSLPLHLAVAQSASPVVVQMLLKAGPAILLERDGRQGLTPLGVSIVSSSSSSSPSSSPSTNDNNTKVLQLLLLQSQPEAATIPSIQTGDLPLHLACLYYHKLSFALLQALIQAYPEALLKSNRQGFRPADLMAFQPLSLHRNQGLKYLREQQQQQQLQLQQKQAALQQQIERQQRFQQQQQQQQQQQRQQEFLQQNDQHRLQVHHNTNLNGYWQHSKRDY